MLLASESSGLLMIYSLLNSWMVFEQVPNPLVKDPLQGE